MGLRHSDFMRIFDSWAPTYDDTVYASTPADGFENYEQVLERVARLAGAAPGRSVLDVGTGTGNLARVLVRHGASVTAVEPSAEMRKVAGEKLPGVPILDGQFLSLSVANESQDAVVSTYAFHHLTDGDKVRGAREMLRVLKPGGRIVLGDVAWASDEARAAMIDRFRDLGREDLVQEIEEEYYPTIGTLTTVFAGLGCTVYVEQVNEWVWVLVAGKGARLAH